MANIVDLEQFGERIIEVGGLKDEDIEDPDVCDICLDGEVYDDNEIIFCDNCNVPVHQLCYGVTSIPEGAWYCYVCAQGLKPSDVQCELCGYSGGAYKYCDRTDKWVHPLCANWIPEIYESVSKKGIPIINLKNLDQKRYKLKCNLCNLKGACVQCCYGRCSTPVHPWCALRKPQGFTRRIIKDNDGNILWEIFCKTHAKAVSEPLKKSKQNKIRYEESQDDYLDFEDEPEVINPRPRRSFNEHKEDINHDSITYNINERPKKDEKNDSKPNETNFIIPNYLEWPGITEGEGMDLDHFWNCISSYYVEDHPEKWLDFILSSFSNLNSLYQPKLESTEIQDVLTELKTSLGNDRNRSNHLYWEKRDALLLKISKIIKILNKEHELSCEYKSNEPQSCDSIENENEKQDKKQPIIMDHHHFSLNNNFYYQNLEENEDIENDPLIEIQRRGESVLRAVIDSDNRYGTEFKINLIKPDQDIDLNQSRLIDLQTLKDNQFSEFIIPSKPDCEIDISLQGYKLDCSLQNFTKIESSDEFSLLDRIIKPQDECTELSMLIALDSLAYDNLIESMKNHINDLIDKNKLKELSNKNRVNDPHWNSIYNLFTKQQIWRRIGITLIKGLRDQSSDFNKIEREDLPPSWKIQVNGRPSQEEVANEEDEDGPHEDAICMVCFDGTSTEGNRILFCDGCNATIHQICYGIGEIPEGDYFCDRCKFIQDYFADGDNDPENYDLKNLVKCCMCPLQHGGLKATKDNRWVHLICSFWSKSAVIEDMKEMGPVDISNIPISPFKSSSTLSASETALICIYCRTSGGYLISCNGQNCGDDSQVQPCNVHFHPLCSWYYGNYIQAELIDPTYQGTERGGIYPSGFDYCFLCDSHSSNRRSNSSVFEEQRNLRLKYKIKDEDLSAFPGKIKKRKKNKKKQSGNSQKRQTMGGQQKDLAPDVYTEKQCGICMLPTSTDLFNTNNEYSLLEQDLVDELGKMNSDSLDSLKNIYKSKDDKATSNSEPKNSNSNIEPPSKTILCDFTVVKNESDQMDVVEGETPIDGCKQEYLLCSDFNSRREIITCSKCQTFTVHTNCLKCFDLENLENSWVCTTCKHPQLDDLPHCILCPRMGGYLCQNIDNLYVHAYCARNSPGNLRITNEGKVDIRGIPKENKKQKCIVCNRKSGVTLQCCAEGCANYFHPLCGVKNGRFLLRTRGGNRQAFCSNHIPEGIERLPNGRWIDNVEICRFRYGLDRTRLIIDMLVRRERYKKLLYKAESELYNIKINKLLNKALGRKNIHGDDDIDLDELNFESESEYEDDDDDELPNTQSKTVDILSENDKEYISFDKLTTDKKDYNLIKSDVTEEELKVSNTWIRPGMSTVLKLPKNIKVFFSCLDIRKKDALSLGNVRAFTKYYQDLLDRVEENSRHKTGIFYNRKEEDLFENSLGTSLIQNLKLKEKEFEDFCSRNQVLYDKLAMRNLINDSNMNKRKISEADLELNSSLKRRKGEEDIPGNLEPDLFDQIMSFETKDPYTIVSQYLPTSSNAVLFDNTLFNIHSLISPNDWFNYSSQKLPNLERLLRDILNHLMDFVDTDEDVANSNKKFTPSVKKGRLLADDFLDIPYDLIPDYDINVRTVMTLKIMSNKLNNHLYHSFGSFAFDFYTMLNNGRSVTNPTSWTWKDTRKLAQVFEEIKLSLLINPRCLQSRVSGLAIEARRAGNRNRVSQGSINMRCSECSSLMEVLNWPLDFETCSIEQSIEKESSDSVTPLKGTRTPTKKNMLVEEFETELVTQGDLKRGRISKSFQADMNNYKDESYNWKWICGSCISKLGGDLVGRKVKIWWVDDYKSYSGSLNAMDEISRCHCVLYDDQEWEFINLSVEPVLFGEKINDL